MVKQMAAKGFPCDWILWPVPGLLEFHQLLLKVAFGEIVIEFHDLINKTTVEIRMCNSVHFPIHCLMFRWSLGIIFKELPLISNKTRMSDAGEERTYRWTAASPFVITMRDGLAFIHVT